MEKICPSCGEKFVTIEAIDVCPKCYHVSVDNSKWQGKRSKCPNCKEEVQLFETPAKGHVFHCADCSTIGSVFFDKDLHKKQVKIEKTSTLGRKLTWLLEVPCEYWLRKDEVLKTICPKCPIKSACDEHTTTIEQFCKNKNFEVYVHPDFFEIVHKV